MSKFILPTVLILISIGLYFSYISPTYEDIKKLKAENEEFADVLSRARKLDDTVDELGEKYNTFPAEDLERLEKLLPDGVDNVRLIIDLDSVASARGIRMGDLKLEERSSDGSTAIGADGRVYEAANMSFSVSASYETFLQFLSDLQSSLRMIDVVGLSFKSSDANEYDFGVNIKTYWLK